MMSRPEITLFVLLHFSRLHTHISTFHFLSTFFVIFSNAFSSHIKFNAVYTCLYTYTHTHAHRCTHTYNQTYVHVLYLFVCKFVFVCDCHCWKVSPLIRKPCWNVKTPLEIFRNTSCENVTNHMNALMFKRIYTNRVWMGSFNQTCNIPFTHIHKVKMPSFYVS